MKVLIIEDEAIIRIGIVKKVNWDKLQIDQVFEADNGENGYETIMKENPEIIILDINMPRLSGIELLSRIRNEGFDTYTNVRSTCVVHYTYCDLICTITRADYAKRNWRLDKGIGGRCHANKLRGH